MESSVVHLPPDGVEGLSRLADDVVRTLTQAGLPAWREEEVRQESGGAQVVIDTVDDESGGVLVTWYLHPTLKASVQASIEEGNFLDPDVAFAAGTMEVFRKALLELLERAKFDVVEAPDISGAQALVRRSLPQSPAGSGWRR